MAVKRWDYFQGREVDDLEELKSAWETTTGIPWARIIGPNPATMPSLMPPLTRLPWWSRLAGLLRRTSRRERRRW